MRLGASEPRRVDVRVIAATHCDLERAIAERRFREDLYYRLNIITVHIPSLRERKDEIIPLTHYFMRKHATPTTPPVEISSQLRDALLMHNWPGNIRELENIIRKLLVLRRPNLVAEDLRTRARRYVPSVTSPQSAPTHAPETVLNMPRRDMRPPFVQHTPPESPVSWQGYDMPAYAHQDVTAAVAAAAACGGGSTLAASRALAADPMECRSILEHVHQARVEAETEAILNALNSTLWNRKRAAELLNIDYKALLYKMKKLGIVERAQIAI
jgi:DNA-binding NtrC family response regulator